MDTKTRNISLFKVFMSEEAISAVGDTLRSGMITQGPNVEKFEQNLREYFETENVLTLNSATSGLTLALRLLMQPDIESGWPGFDRSKDRVLTPALTCFATTTALLGNEVKIGWLDVDPATANIDLDDLESKLTPDTKVIYLVHWAGVPVDLERLDSILDKANERLGFRPMVVEDCAHSFGARYDGKPLGNHGNICVYSLQAIKQLTTGDGGVLIVPNRGLYERGKLLRWFGISREKKNFKKRDFRLENDIVEYGYKFHMNDIAATLGIHNLKHIDRLNSVAINNANYYSEALKDLEEKGLISLLKVPPKSSPVYWLYTLFIKGADELRKTQFINYMKDRGVMVSQVHNRNDNNSCVAEYRTTLPHLDVMENELICIPVGWWVTEDDRAYIVKSIKDFFSDV